MSREHHKDEERCKQCGGRCCAIYLNIIDGGSRPVDTWFDEWVEAWDEEFTASGATKISPFFDPLEVHMTGNEHLIDELLAKGIDPNKCKYCSKEGCILPWDLRPNACREYRCQEWRDEVKTNS